LKRDDFGFPPRLDHLLQKVEFMARKDQERSKGGIGGRPEQSLIGKNWITRFLNRHPILASKFASRIDRQRAFANDPRQISEHFRKLGKVIRQQNIKPRAITNVDEKGFLMGYSKRTKVITRRGRKNPRVKGGHQQKKVMRQVRQGCARTQNKKFLRPVHPMRLAQ
jgi:hypothetical protein